MNKNSKYRHGIFKPVNLDKFIGERAVYRSGLELKFFRFCDNNANVLKWGSENIKIPYFNKLTGRTHRYHIDNYVVIKEGNQITKYCVEIKPYNQTLPPKTKKLCVAGIYVPIPLCMLTHLIKQLTNKEPNLLIM